MIKAGMKPRKRLGQHFLTDKNVIEKLVKFIQPTSEDNIVEIGPGLGALTFALLPYVSHLHVIEFDRDLAASLEERHDLKLIVYEQDALQFNFPSLKKENKKIRVVGNLPYNISTPLLFHLLSYADEIQDMHFMLQKEVVDRIVAKPRNKTYGRLSVMMQYACDVESLMDIVPDSFYPSPKVMSAFIRLIPFPKPPYPARDVFLFSQLVKQAFNQRRKTLKNSLHSMVSDEAFTAANIDSQRRAEELSISEFVALSNATALLHDMIL